MEHHKTWMEARTEWEESVDNWFEQQIRSGPPPLTNPVHRIEKATPEKNMGPVDEVRGRALTTVNRDDFSPKPPPKTPEAD